MTIDKASKLIAINEKLQEIRFAQKVARIYTQRVADGKIEHN